MTLQREHFEARYAADPDPWDFETSAYEHDKYARTLAALGDRRYARGLRGGLLDRRLHRDARRALRRRCSPSTSPQAAVDAARERLAAHDHVRVERRTLPSEWPAGPFDLVVCSELLYYWDRATLEEALRSSPTRWRPAAASSRCTTARRRPSTR